MEFVHSPEFQAAQNKLFEQFGVFFAFSKEQFKQGLQEIQESLGVKKPQIVSLFGSGSFILKENKEKFEKAHEELFNKFLARSLSEKGKKQLILDELNNFEVFYCSDSLPDAIERLASFGFTEAEVIKVYKENL